MNQYYPLQLRHRKKVVLLFVKGKEHGLSAVTWLYGRFHPQSQSFDKDLDSASVHISVWRADANLCCSISCCIKCMQDDLCVRFFLVILQIRHISLGPLAFAAIHYYSSGSISFCILDGLLCEVVCQLILCASTGKELFIVTKWWA